MTTRFAFHLASISSIALLSATAPFLTAAPASAQTWTGNASSDWTDAGNWSGGVPTNGSVTVNTPSNSAVLGVSGAAAGSTGDFSVGTGGGSGSLTIQNGSTLTSGPTLFIVVGRDAGSTGVVNITGPGSTWHISDPTRPLILGRNLSGSGAAATGRLIISNGGAFTGGSDIVVGEVDGTGILTVSSGGMLSTGRDAYIGRFGGSNGTATITGTGSSWSIASRLFVGNGGPGTVNISNNALVTVGNTTYVADSGSDGTLNISSGGTLQTPSLQRAAGVGTPQVNFDRGTLRATVDTAGFITGFSGSQLNIASGGLTIDTNGFDVTAASPFSGTGALTKTRAGTLTLTDVSTYTGQTIIQTGTLALTGNGSIENSMRVVADGIFDISGVTPTTANIRGLGGSGSVVLGSKTLNLTDANGIFAGSVTGTGGLAVSAGLQTLTGSSNYTGATAVNGTGYLLVRDGGQITATSNTTLNGPQATATVMGTGSLLKTTSLNVGSTAGSNAALILAGGGVVEVAAGTTALGGTNGQTAMISVDGTGSRLTHGGSLGVGSSSSAVNAYLNITNGGTVESNVGLVGTLGVPTGEKSVLIDGAGSTWSITGLFGLNSGAEVSILNGGSATAAELNVGITSGASNLLVSGAGSQAIFGGAVAIGSVVGTGTVTLSNSGSMTVGTTLTLANGPGATGTINIGGAEGQAATSAGILNASTIMFGTGNGRLNFNQTDAHYGFGTVLVGSGTVNHAGPGLTEITSNSAAFTGTTNVSGGALAVNGRLCGDMNVLVGGRLQGVGAVCDTSNAGAIAPGNSIGTLTVAGDYVGNGGLLEIEAVLGGDDLTAANTDLLHVTGSTSGSTNVRVTNLGGAGAQTVEGIRIVQVDGASAADAFALLGDYVFEGEQAVVGGAYAYRLYQGSTSDPGDGDWYLRSALIPVTPPPGPVAPLYQPGAPLYESYAGVLQTFNELGTLQQRVGNRSWATDGAEDGFGLWAELYAAGISLNPETSTSGASYDSRTWKMVAGIDAPLGSFESGELVVGLNAQYGTINADVSSLFGNGSIGATGYGLGGSLTWYGDNGFYLDAQGQLTWFSSALSSSTSGTSLVNDNGGFGYAAGLEIGQRIEIAPEWSVTPQAQLSHSSVNFDPFSDAFGALIDLNESHALLGRLGLSLDRQSEWQDASGQDNRSHLYGIANLYFPLTAGSSVDVGGTLFESGSGDTWGGIGIGGSLNLADDKYSIFGEALAKTSFRDFGGSHALSGSVGFRVKM